MRLHTRLGKELKTGEYYQGKRQSHDKPAWSPKPHPQIYFNVRILAQEAELSEWTCYRDLFIPIGRGFTLYIPELKVPQSSETQPASDNR